METKIDIGSLVRSANDDSRALYIVDGIVGCDFRLLDKAGGWSLMDRSSVVLADDQDVSVPSDTTDDQYTGDDLGAQMAAAETAPMVCCDQCALKEENHREADGSVIFCPVFSQFRSLGIHRFCGDFQPLQSGDAPEGWEG